MKTFPNRARVTVKRANGELLAEYIRTYRGNRRIAADRMTRAALRKYPDALRVTVAALD